MHEVTRRHRALAAALAARCRAGPGTLPHRTRDDSSTKRDGKTAPRTDQNLDTLPSQGHSQRWGWPRATSSGKTAGLVGSPRTFALVIAQERAACSSLGDAKLTARTKLAALPPSAPCPGPPRLGTACCQAPRASLLRLSLLPSLCEVTSNPLIAH